MYNRSCATCALLDKSRHKPSPNSVNQKLYGCNKTPNGYVCGWCKQDSELKLQGCSFFQATAKATQPQPKQQPPKAPTPTTGVQLSIFDLL